MWANQLQAPPPAARFCPRCQLFKPRSDFNEHMTSVSMCRACLDPGLTNGFIQVTAFQDRRRDLPGKPPILYSQGDSDAFRALNGSNIPASEAWRFEPPSARRYNSSPPPRVYNGTPPPNRQAPRPYNHAGQAFGPAPASMEHNGSPPPNRQALIRYNPGGHAPGPYGYGGGHVSSHAGPSGSNSILVLAPPHAPAINSMFGSLSMGGPSAPHALNPTFSAPFAAPRALRPQLNVLPAGVLNNRNDMIDPPPRPSPPTFKAPIAASSPPHLKSPAPHIPFKALAAPPVLDHPINTPPNNSPQAKNSNINPAPPSPFINATTMPSFSSSFPSRFIQSEPGESNHPEPADFSPNHSVPAPVPAFTSSLESAIAPFIQPPPAAPWEAPAPRLAASSRLPPFPKLRRSTQPSPLRRVEPAPPTAPAPDTPPATPSPRVPAALPPKPVTQPDPPAPTTLPPKPVPPASTALPSRPDPRALVPHPPVEATPESSKSSTTTPCAPPRVPRPIPPAEPRRPKNMWDMLREFHSYDVDISFTEVAPEFMYSEAPDSEAAELYRQQYQARMDKK